MAKIPKFKSLDEAAAFWDSHDFEDYVDDTKPVKVSVRLSRAKRILTVPLELRVFEKLETLAEKRGVVKEKMVSRWIKERVGVESAH